MSLFDIDQYWLLLYQVFLDKKIENPYKDLNKYLPLARGKTEQIKEDKARNLRNHDQKSFDVLKSNGVSFISLKELVPEKYKKPNLIKKVMAKLSTKVAKKVEETAT
jgi:N-glycosylase/DNA lyase